MLPLVLVDALCVRQIPIGADGGEPWGAADDSMTGSYAIVHGSGDVSVVPTKEIEAAPDVLGTLECSTYRTSEGLWAPHCQRRAVRVRYTRNTRRLSAVAPDRADFFAGIERALHLSGASFATSNECGTPTALQDSPDFPEQAAFDTDWLVHLTDDESTPLPLCAARNTASIVLGLWLGACLPSASRRIRSGRSTPWRCPACGHTRPGIGTRANCPDCGSLSDQRS